MDLYTSYEAYQDAICEQWGDGYQNESQRAFAESRSRLADERDEVNRAIDLYLKMGLTVVVATIDAHCRVTDAVVGEVPTILFATETRLEAVAKLTAWRDEDEWFDSEYTNVKIL